MRFKRKRTFKALQCIDISLLPLPLRRFSLFLPRLTVLRVPKEPASAMERLVKNIVGPRESGYIKEQDLRKFLLTTFGSGIQFNIRVRQSMAKHPAASYADL